MYEKPLPTSPPTCSELLHLAAWLDLVPSSNVTSSSSTVKFVSSLVIKYSKIGNTLNLKYAAENSLNTLAWRVLCLRVSFYKFSLQYRIITCSLLSTEYSTCHVTCYSSSAVISLDNYLFLETCLILHYRVSFFHIPYSGLL